MAGTARVSLFKPVLTFITVTLGLLGCSASQPVPPPVAKAPVVAPTLLPVEAKVLEAAVPMAVMPARQRSATIPVAKRA